MKKILLFLFTILCCFNIANADTIVKTLTANSDDCTDDGGALYLGESFTYFESGYDNGFLFSGITIPSGSIIDDMYIEFTNHNVGTGLVNMRIKGHKIASSSTFTTHTDFINRTRTANSVAWSNIEEWTDLNNYFYRTVSFPSVGQEIVDFSSGLSNENIAIFIKDDGGSVGSRPAICREQASTKSARLTIVYHLGGGCADTLVAPVFETPADGATGQVNSVILDWSDSTQVGTPTSYDLQVDDNNDFSSPVFTSSTSWSRDTVTTVLSPLTTYYWRIRGNTSCHTSPYSGRRSFTMASVPCDTLNTPILATPSNGSTGQINPVTLNWGDITGATNYTYQVDNNSDFSSITASGNVTPSVASVSTNLAASTQYSWRVYANGCDTSLSAVFTFSMSSCPDTLGNPSLTSPSNGASGLTNPVTLDWADVTGATGYNYEVDDNSNFASPFVTGSTSVSTVDISSLSNSVTYYWRIMATKSCDNSSWSTSRSFTMTSGVATNKRYISKSGSDSNTGQSWAQAWLTIDKLNSSVSSGDTVYFGSGIWRGRTLFPVGGTVSNPTVYACSSFVTAGETAVTNHPAKIYGSTQITGWNSLGSGIYSSSTSGISTNAVIFSGEYLLLNNSNPALSEEQFWVSGSEIRVRLRGSIDPSTTSVEINNTSSSNQSGRGISSYVNDGSQGLGSVLLDATQYVKFFGLEFKYGNNQTVIGVSDCDNITLYGCKIGPTAGMGNINPGGIYLNNSSNINNNWVVRACSLGSCYAMTGSSLVADWGSSITLYTTSNMVVDSCVFYGFQTLAAIYHKNDAGSETYGNIFSHNLFDLDDSPASWNFNTHFWHPCILLWRDQSNEWVYGNTFKGHPNGAGVVLAPGTDTDTSYYVFNNTFIDVGLPFATEWRTLGTVRKRNAQFKYNVIYSTSLYANIALLTGDIGSPTGPTIIDSNLYFVDGDIFKSGASGSGTQTDYTFSQWKLQGFDVNSNSSLNSANQDFANLAGGNYSRPNAVLTEMGATGRTYGGKTWYIFGAIQQGGQSPKPPIKKVISKR